MSRYHEVIVANKLDKTPDNVYTVVGPICESGDILARDRRLPRVEKGDLIAILDTGVYGFAMKLSVTTDARALVKSSLARVKQKLFEGAKPTTIS